MSRALAALLAALALAAGAWSLPGATADEPAADLVASGFDVSRFPTPQPACAGAALPASFSLARQDCGLAEVTIAGTDGTETVTADIVAPDGTTVLADDLPATFDAGTWQIEVTPQADWPAGELAVRYAVGGEPAGGGGAFFLNQLAVTAQPAEQPGGYAPGQAIPVSGKVVTQQSGAAGTQERDAGGAQVTLTVTGPDGGVLATLDAVTADPDGTFDATIPGAATADLDPDQRTDYRLGLGLRADATYTDPGPTTPGAWAVDDAPAGRASVVQTPDEPVLESSFVSSVGWVKPGAGYPFQLRVRNFTDAPFTGITVTAPVPDGTTFAAPAGATVAGGVLTWDVGDVPAGETARLVVEATADTLEADPQVVWKDLSATASLTYDGQEITDTSHGPKVIPPSGGYETARYGDRPFPVVPVAYSDRAPEASASSLADVINDPDNPGSTFNLYQEMSYGQLFPQGSVPSAGVAQVGWDYAPGFDFTNYAPKADTCRGITNNDLPGDTYQQLQPNRIQDGWYQLPGSTDYYGDDSNGSALIGALAGVGALQAIDSGCGPTGKAVYDAAQIADPDIDYSDFDTDKDGVVDFFMMVYVGAGGNGESQLEGVPPYDNIWPHSSSLEDGYVDPATGLKGYVSDDQLRDEEGRRLWYTDATRSEMTTDDKGDDLRVFVRVGPYNVNPETAIDKASVISHEYGHSLGLPDYYSTGSRQTYGDWSLMATDKSQNIDVVGKEELGWTIPRVLEDSRDVSGWEDTKKNTHRIDWKAPDGTPYTLQGDGVDNGEAYVASLPGRQLLDAVPSGSRAWYSGSGNDFGCPPSGGHNLDIALPSLPDGVPITLTFKTRFDVEWDFDYGFVLTSTDGETYTSHESASGYTTPAAQNPNANPCQTQYGNGITGSNGSYDAGTAPVDRVLGQYPDGGFTDDEYDLSDLAGEEDPVLRFSYATDPGLARPGWFVDDVVVTAGDQVVYESDFEDPAETAIYNGGCREGLQTARQCTDGWQNVTAGQGSPAEHKYLLEMRDRSGFDFESRGENDRDPLGFDPGVLLAYTDENHGYGNVGTDDPPAQSPLDSQPEPESEDPELDDAAFTTAAGDGAFSDAPGDPHVDNYTDPARESGLWTFDFGCLDFAVRSLTGTGLGPDTGYDLAGDVDFTIGDGCGPFDYGTVVEPGGGNVAPTAVAQAKPTTVAAGEAVTFDGSASFDDVDAPGALGYAWDFGDGASGEGASVRHAFAAAGTYTAELTVTDGGGLTGVARVPVTVTPGAGDGSAPSGSPTPAPTTVAGTPGPGGGSPGAPGGDPGAPGAGGPPSACTSTRAFRSVRVRRAGRGLRFSATRRRADARFSVRVTRVATLRRTLPRPRQVKRFRGRAGAFRWRARGLPDGVYVARFRAGGDVRPVALRRVGGRWRAATRFSRVTACGLLARFALSAPAFDRRVRVVAQLRGEARVRAVLLRGGRVVRRLPARSGRAYGARVRARGLRRGAYKVRITVVAGGRRTRATLGVRRL